MSKYLVRPDDSMIFTLNEEYGVYEILDGPTDIDGNPPIPYAHFTYENLTEVGFFPIEESELKFYQNKRDQYFRKLRQERENAHD
jgi:hypothetical protein